MKARDTVMNDKQIYDIVVLASRLGKDEHDTDIAIAKAQAELSFKAGIREVVEWIQYYLPDYEFGSEWQDKIKGWGI